jgi:hypothetical protein
MVIEQYKSYNIVYQHNIRIIEIFNSDFSISLMNQLNYL